jgi:hypothetical protein
MTPFYTMCQQAVTSTYIQNSVQSNQGYPQMFFYHTLCVKNCNVKIFKRQSCILDGIGWKERTEVKL